MVGGREVNMNVVSQSHALSVIIARYFASSKKQFLHYGDCQIYLARRPFCGCGFLYQLGYLDHALANIIYPKYEKELYLQDTGKVYKRNRKEEAKSLALLEKVFGKIDPPSFEDLKYDYDDYKKILNNCLTQQNFPKGFKALDSWLRKAVAKR